MALFSVAWASNRIGHSEARARAGYFFEVPNWRPFPPLPGHWHPPTKVVQGYQVNASTEFSTKLQKEL
eukprot:2014546-Rhodomonas_salina.2